MRREWRRRLRRVRESNNKKSEMLGFFAPLRMTILDLRMTNHGCICWMMGFSIGGWRGLWMWCW